MNLNDIGSWCVVWINKPGPTSAAKLAHAFFYGREEALLFQANVGGELYLKHPDGSLKRNG